MTMSSTSLVTGDLSRWRGDRTGRMRGSGGKHQHGTSLKRWSDKRGHRKEGGEERKGRGAIKGMREGRGGRARGRQENWDERVGWSTERMVGDDWGLRERGGIEGGWEVTRGGGEGEAGGKTMWSKKWETWDLVRQTESQKGGDKWEEGCNWAEKGGERRWCWKWGIG